MTMDPEALREEVVAVLAEALDQDPARVVPQASLIDDLGAESIDFLDIVFRLEAAFGIKIPAEEIWKGSLRSDDPVALAEGLARLRERMPGFDWRSFPDKPRREDLARLITVRTVLDYLQPRLAPGGPASPSA
jgi:acyl carrier protein